MKYKKFSFSVLEEIQKKKIAIEIITIKNLHLKKNKNIEQLQLLINYQKEYLKTLNDKMILGMCIHQWKNYNSFINILQTIIRDNINEIEKNKKMIEESLKIWSKNQITLKIWKHLHQINEKAIFKIKKIKEEIINDNYIQLKFLK